MADLLAAVEAAVEVAAGKIMLIAAISGGVDSVVLLDLLSKRYKTSDIIVAHVNHGIRVESSEDADFVRKMSSKYGMQYRQIDLNLGLHASEEVARDQRYTFLRKLSKEFNAKIVTAHHADDIIETIAINLVRGTGWRGLAVMSAKDIYRPLTCFYKNDLLLYAKKNGLEWREDSTNSSDLYLRNRLRKRIKTLNPSIKQNLIQLWRNQTKIARDINKETAKFSKNSRYFYLMISNDVAVEILRNFLLNKGIAQTRPQLNNILISIKTAKAGSKRTLNSSVGMCFSTSEFWLEFC